MTDQPTMDTITPAEFTGLQLRAMRMEAAVAEYAKLRVQLEDTEARAEAASRLGTGYMAAAEKAEAERDGAYRERAQLLALLASLHPSVIAPAPDVEEDGWQILYLRIGGKQASWHIAPRDAELYAHVQHVPVEDSRAQWDGHTTEEKYAHIGQHAAQLYAEACGRVETPLGSGEQGAPVDWQAVVQRRERELKTVGEARHRAEAAVQRVTALRERWVKAGPPPLGTPINRWLDRRLVELNAVLDEPKES